MLKFHTTSKNKLGRKPQSIQKHKYNMYFLEEYFHLKTSTESNAVSLENKCHIFDISKWLILTFVLSKREEDHQ